MQEYQLIENKNKNTNLRTAERHLKRTRDNTPTILRPTRENTHWITRVAALSLEETHAPAWGPFFFCCSQYVTRRVLMGPVHSHSFKWPFNAPSGQICSQRQGAYYCKDCLGIENPQESWGRWWTRRNTT